MIKFEAVYPTPFWRAAGLNGYSNSDRPPVGFTYRQLTAQRQARACCSGSWPARTPAGWVG